MDKYLQAEKRLAELQHPDCEFTYNTGIGKWTGRVPGHVTTVYLPPYCRDWAACGPLMVEHDCYPQFRPSGLHTEIVKARYGQYVGEYVEEAIADHPDKDTAVRYAIVMAVIKKLEAANGT